MAKDDEIFSPEDLAEFKRDNQHDEVVELLRAISEDEKYKEIAKGIQNNALQISKFVEAFKAIKIDVPAAQVKVDAPQVSVELDQEKVIRAIGGMFEEMKKYIATLEAATEQLSKDVKELNATNQKPREMLVQWNYGRVEKIVVTVGR